MTDEILGLNEAASLVRRIQSPRYIALDRLERFVETTHYEHLPNFWNSDVPLMERAPCIADTVVAQGISSNTDLVLSDYRFPVLCDDDADDDSESVAALATLVKQAGLKRAFRESFSEAQGCGTSVLILGVRGGKPVCDSVKAKWCEPKFDVGGVVAEMVICYAFTRTERDGNAYRAVPYLYRRKIDATRDVTYKPHRLLADTDPELVKWVEDSDLSRDHELGVCPVVWYRHMVGISSVEQIDGKAIHRLLLDELQAHDWALSMRHRAAIKLGEPQICEIGVSPGFNPTEAGRTERIAGAPGNPVALNPSAPIAGGSYVNPSESRDGSRKKGVGFIWQYPNEKARVEMLALPPGSLEALDEEAADLRNKLNSAMAIVTLDPENIKFAATTSGKALETLKQRQLDRCDQYRDDLADNLIRPVIDMMILICKRLIGELKSKKLREALGHLADDFDLKIEWGPYFRTGVEEQSKISQQAREDLEAHLITLETAVERIAPIYGITNVDEYVKKLEEAKASAMAEQAELLHAAAGSMSEDDEDPSPDPAGPKGDPKGAPVVGSGGAAPAASKSAKRRQRRAAASDKSPRPPA